jgi:ferrochelatase
MPIILASFGGPRDLDEVRPFLEELLTDRDVVRTPFPPFFDKALFSWIAKRRTPRIQEQYKLIGGGSPIYQDTENLAKELENSLKTPVIPFHRYLKSTHASFIEKISSFKGETMTVFPLFPQFTYATTGSAARWFKTFLKNTSFEWVKSYPTHEKFVKAYQIEIQKTLKENGLKEEECLLLFSAHGIPKSYVKKGDPYEKECQASFNAIKEPFKRAKSLLCYQSRFGPAEWLKPYTGEIAENITHFSQEKKTVLFVPIAFTSDHIETLFEVEYEYLPEVKSKGLQAFRVGALQNNTEWKEGIGEIIKESPKINTDSLIRS